MFANMVRLLSQLLLTPFEVSLALFKLVKSCDIDFRCAGGSRNGVVEWVRVEGTGGGKRVFGVVVCPETWSGTTRGERRCQSLTHDGFVPVDRAVK